ncbi:MAG: glycerate dehydrogenase [Acidimicrobiia bacterium]|nr:glycerate dehydrogenase [Acidimicrobiia bacterium]
MARIVIPDDFPQVMAPSPSYRRFAVERQVNYFDSLPGSEDRLIERIQNAEVVINIRSSSKFTAPVLESCPSLRLLSLWGTGTDNVDLASASRLGITVTNTPAVAAVSIAEHCLALMLAVARRIPQIDSETRGGAWPRGQTTQMSGKTLGVIGLGAIGSRFARLGEAVGMKVNCWTMHPDTKPGFTLVPLEYLLAESDVVSLHLRLSADTHRFLSRARLAQMKSSAILINTARGAIVDEAALVEALQEKRLAGAGLDVFEVEPLPAGHALTKLDNVVLSPHSAGVTPEALEAGLALALDNVESFLAGKPQHVVAAPAA